MIVKDQNRACGFGASVVEFSMRADVQGGAFTPGQGSEIDVAALGRALWRHWGKILGLTLAVAAITLVGVNVVTPKYKSQALILIEGRENAFLRPEADKQTGAADSRQVDPEAVTSQVQILTSRDLARQVIKNLKLTDLPEFDPVKNGVSVTKVILSMLGLAKDPLSMGPEERALDAFYERLAVVPIEKSRVISIEFQSADPDLAARVANALADAYLSVQQAAKQEQTRGAGQWLASEIDKLRPKVTEAEEKVEDFRAKANLLAGTNNANLGNQQLTDLTTQLAAARAQKADLDAKSRMIRNLLTSGKPIESADISASELLRRMIEQRVTLRAQLAEQSSTLLERHPRIQELRAQVNALDVQIRGELEKLVRSLENDARIAAGRVEATNAALEQLKRQVAATGGQDVQLRALEREARAQRELLESYLAKYREATARDSIDAAPADARIISRATVSNIPSYPKKLPIVVLATLGTMFLSITFILASQFLGAAPAPLASRAPVMPRSRFALFDRFLRPSPAPAAIVRPAAAKAPPAAMPIGELARTLRHLGEAGRRITVIGAARDVGTTHTAIGLARALVAQAARVVLVDLAIGAPNLSVIATEPEAPGIAELVRGDASFGDIITRDRYSRVHLVTMGRMAGEGAAIFSSVRLVTALEALARAYDHVIIDAGAVPETQVESFARLAPRAVLVVKALADPANAGARERLMAAGFTDVTVFQGNPGGPDAAARPAAA